MSRFSVCGPSWGNASIFSTQLNGLSDTVEFFCLQSLLPTYPLVSKPNPNSAQALRMWSRVGSVQGTMHHMNMGVKRA